MTPSAPERSLTGEDSVGHSNTTHRDGPDQGDEALDTPSSQIISPAFWGLQSVWEHPPLEECFHISSCFLNVLHLGINLGVKRLARKCLVPWVNSAVVQTYFKRDVWGVNREQQCCNCMYMNTLPVDR